MGPATVKRNFDCVENSSKSSISHYKMNVLIQIECCTERTKTENRLCVSRWLSHVSAVEWSSIASIKAICLIGRLMISRIVIKVAKVNDFRVNFHSGFNTLASNQPRHWPAARTLLDRAMIGFLLDILNVKSQNIDWFRLSRILDRTILDGWSSFSFWAIRIIDIYLHITGADYITSRKW